MDFEIDAVAGEGRKLDDAALKEHLEKLERLKKNLTRVIQGKSEAIDMLLVALLSGGSVLIEDVPGVGKTTLAKALAKSMDSDFGRIQFTPDLLPMDVLGSSIYNPQDGSFTFHAGPIFCNVLLADEINRASPRTQSALLEAMGEMQATIEGECHLMPSPFMVLATENPIEFQGTYPLPEAQLDRFLMLLDLGYPDAETEVDILFIRAKGDPLAWLDPVVSKDDIFEMQHLVRQVGVDRNIAEYIVEIVNRTRGDQRLRLGASPRGSLMLFRACQAAAFADGRNFVLPDDVQRLGPSVLAHRLVLTAKAKYDGAGKRDLVRAIINEVPVPA